MADGEHARPNPGATLDALYAAIESFDGARIEAALRPDAFVLTATAEGVLTSAARVVEDLARWSRAIAADGGALRLRATRQVVGMSRSGLAAWVFDDVAAEVVRGDGTACSLPIRLTALLTSDEGWRISAAYWSVPFPTQAEQDAVKHTGELAPGRALSEDVDEDAAALAHRLRAALSQPRLLPGLYSESDDHVTLGSVVDEVFRGSAGRAAWSEFVQHVTDFALRGGVRAALAGPDTAWLAANIDIGAAPPTPYRFFYVWALGDAGWEIVVSHDGVSRDPLRARAE